MIVKPTSPSVLRQHRQEEEREALNNYAAALKQWERARDLADNVAWELEMTTAELQQNTVEACSNAELAALRQARRNLQARHRQCQNDSRRAKERASKTFTALAAARNARLELEKCLDEAGVEDYGSIVCLPHLSLAPAQLQWN